MGIVRVDEHVAGVEVGVVAVVALVVVKGVTGRVVVVDVEG